LHRYHHHRSAPPAALEQARLPLDYQPSDEPALRDAYNQVPELARRGITYHQAIAIDAMRICLARVAEAIRHGRSTKEVP
jgi:hypothetical protein